MSRTKIAVFVSLSIVGILLTVLLSLWMAFFEPYRRQAVILKELKAAGLLGYAYCCDNPRFPEWFIDLLPTSWADSLKPLEFIEIEPQGDTADFTKIRLITRLPLIEDGIALCQIPVDADLLKALSRHRGITTIFLNNTKIDNETVQHLTGFPKLEGLGLASNAHLTEQGVADLLKRLPKLKFLELIDFPGIDKFEMRAIARHTTLKHLDLRDCLLTDDDLKTLSELKQLHILTLSQMPGITEQGILKLFDNLPELTDFHLKGMSPFSPEAVRKIIADPRLEYLELCDMGLTDAHLKEVVVGALLFSFDISDNPEITDAGLKHLHGIGTLKYLYLNGTGVTQEGINAFKAAQPHCEVIP